MQSPKIHVSIDIFAKTHDKPQELKFNEILRRALKSSFEYIFQSRKLVEFVWHSCQLRSAQAFYVPPGAECAWYQFYTQHWSYAWYWSSLFPGISPLTPRYKYCTIWCSDYCIIKVVSNTKYLGACAKSAKSICSVYKPPTPCSLTAASIHLHAQLQADITFCIFLTSQ